MTTARSIRTQPQNATRAGTALAAVLMTAQIAAVSAPAAAQDVTAETLLDRIQVEDFLTRYYFDLSNGDAHELSYYFTEDAVLDVDGTIAVGHDEIEALYGGGPSADDDADRPAYPRGHMLLTNPVIAVNGDTAIAHVIWTGVMNDGVGEAPRLYEQGREDTELVKRDGRWLIKRRYISSDSGIPDRFDATWEPRGNPLEE